MTNNFDHSDDENGLNAEDLKFFKNRAKFLGNFAEADLNTSNESKKMKKDKKKNPAGLDALEAAEDAQATALRKMQSSLQKNKNDHESEESEEDELDRRAKKSKKSFEEASEEVKLGLPIRTATGEWKRQRQAAVKVTATESVKNSEDAGDEEENESIISQNIPVATGTELPGFEESKERLALIAMEITEDIDENVTKLKELLKYTRLGCMKGSREEEIELLRMGLITCVAVFKDILPDYWIRPLTEAERQVKVSKEVKKQRHFEETLLRSYGQFVDRLEEILKTVKKGDAAAVAVAVGCLGELAIHAGHFNYYERVLAALCNQIFNGKEHVSSAAIASVSKVFAEDEIGRSTAHALRLISDSIQARDYLPNVRCLEVLQHVRMKLLAFSRTDTLPSDKRIASEEAARLDIYKKKAVHMSKSQKKNLKAELAESIKSARSEAEFSREERSKWSSDALKFLFRILFGILKRFTNASSNESKVTKVKAVELLPEVMKSLAKCSQFLSVEYFTDLLSTLKKTIGLIEAEQSLTATLHTVQAVLQIAFLQETSKVEILKGPGAVALIDLKFYFDLIYRQLPNLKKMPNWSKDFEVLFEAVMSKLFLSKKHCPSTRVAAFIHRFASLIEEPSTPVESKIYFLRLIARLMERHEKTRGLLDQETLGVAAYLPNCHDPDLCNPFCKQLDIDGLIKKVGIKVPNDILTIIRRIKQQQ
jgi:nucleolar complex protein 3